ncbi:aldehyde dehydrogenase family protein [Arthrobacter sp. OVS8]|nr:aldehyde dehydrogenase family protein [Arthrobacter sp. OVS8]
MNGWTSSCGQLPWPTNVPRTLPRPSAPKPGSRSPKPGEASRSGNIIRLAAYEGSQLYGSTLPLDANAGTGLDKIGFTLRQPCGIVVAITPFNYPALLVLHKIAPALAAGNAVVLKPARATPLTALKLAQCFVDAGLPPEALSVLTGPGSTLGDVLVTDPGCGKSPSPGPQPQAPGSARSPESRNYPSNWAPHAP